jgi:hypothetical protein
MGIMYLGPAMEDSDVAAEMLGFKYSPVSCG